MHSTEENTASAGENPQRVGEDRLHSQAARTWRPLEAEDLRVEETLPAAECMHGLLAERAGGSQSCAKPDMTSGDATL